MTINELLLTARRKLAGVSETPNLDAEWLLLDVLGKHDSSWLIANGSMELTREKEKKYNLSIERRAKGEPLAYILGWWEFYGRRFKVTPDVLVPRPATEELVDKALEKIFSLNKLFGRPITVADVGTGSGCIAITLAKKAQLHHCESRLSGAKQSHGIPRDCHTQSSNLDWVRNDDLGLIQINKIIATDVSEAALIVARENGIKHGVADKIEWRQGNMLKAIKNDPVDLIVSNPPYVPSAEIDRVLLSPTPETAGLAFEPRAALDGGRDGMQYVKQIQECGIPYVIESAGGKILEG